MTKALEKKFADYSAALRLAVDDDGYNYIMSLLCSVSVDSIEEYREDFIREMEKLFSVAGYRKAFGWNDDGAFEGMVKAEDDDDQVQLAMANLRTYTMCGFISPLVLVLLKGGTVPIKQILDELLASDNDRPVAGA